MKYFLDTEFTEGFHKPLFGKRRHFIDLISIGITDEDGREYYAISKEFDLKIAWKDEWIRANVLKPIHAELVHKLEGADGVQMHIPESWFTLSSLRKLLGRYGKSNFEIMQDIIRFVKPAGEDTGLDYVDWVAKYSETEFYAYYADYDWVVFCSLFGRMIDLPKGFPMYCKDLKQVLDEKTMQINGFADTATMESKLRRVKMDKDYPKQTNEHNAMADAKWNYELYKFLNSI